MKIQKFQFGPFQVNSYVLWDENTKDAVVVDAGCLFDNEKQELKSFIEQNELKLQRLINTHLHIDHIFGNPFMFEQYGLKPEANKDDEFWLVNANQQARMFGFELEEKQVPLGGYLNEGDQVKFGNEVLDIFKVPGHSPGSLVFYNKKTGDLFAGDVLFYESVGRADLQGGNFKDLKENIIKKLFILPGESVVYPGHGPSTTIEHEKLYNPFFTNTESH